MALFLTTNCSKEKESIPVTLPVLSTTVITNATSTTAVSGGNITSNGGALVTSRGVCWSINLNPTIFNDTTLNGNGSGAFTSNISGFSYIHYVSC